MKISDFLIFDGDGSRTAGDPRGNNLAFICFECSFPVLASTLENQPGSDEEHPATCRCCNRKYFLDVREHARKLYIHPIDDD